MNNIDSDDPKMKIKFSKSAFVIFIMVIVISFTFGAMYYRFNYYNPMYAQGEENFNKKLLTVDDLRNSTTIGGICLNKEYGIVGCTVTCVNWGQVDYIYECYSDVLIQIGNDTAAYTYFTVYNYDYKHDSIISDRWYKIAPRNTTTGRWILEDNYTTRDPNLYSGGDRN